MALSCLMLFIGPAVAQDFAPGLGIELLEVAASLAEDPRALTAITDHVRPGALLERRIAVSNGTDSPMAVALYGAAADIERGWTVADGRGGNELTGWIDVVPAALTLDPGERREALVRIRVPADAGGGERYAAVLAETGGDDDVPGIQVVSRVGIRVYLSVGGPQAPEEDFRIDSLTGGRSAEGVPFVRVAVTNTGGRAVDVAGELILREGPGGVRGGPFPVVLPRTVGPGAVAALDVPLDAALPAGSWQVRADLSSGLVERRAQATITFPEMGVGSAVPAEAPATRDRRPGPVISWALSLIPITLLIALLLVLRRRRDRRRGEDADAAGPPEEGMWAPPPAAARVGGMPVPGAPPVRPRRAPVTPPPPS